MLALNKIWSSHTGLLMLVMPLLHIKIRRFFQNKLKAIIDRYARQGYKIIEMGCESGADRLILLYKLVCDRFGKVSL